VLFLLNFLLPLDEAIPFIAPTKLYGTTVKSLVAAETLSPVSFSSLVTPFRFKGEPCSPYHCRRGNTLALTVFPMDPSSVLLH